MIIKIEFCSEFTHPNKSKKHEKHKPVEAIFYFFFFFFLKKRFARTIGIIHLHKKEKPQFYLNEKNYGKQGKMSPSLQYISIMTHV